MLVTWLHVFGGFATGAKNFCCWPTTEADSLGGGTEYHGQFAHVEAKGDIVTKEALMRRVWPGAIVDDNSLQVQISALRKALGQDAALLITTVPRRGYCFTNKRQWREAAATAAKAEEAPSTPSERPSPI